MIFLAGIVAGGLAQWIWWSLPGVSQASAIGASGGVSALFATAGWAIGGRALMTRWAAGWAAVNVLLVLTEPMIGIGIAWAAHMGGFLAGMVLAPYCVKAGSTGFSITR